MSGTVVPLFQTFLIDSSILKHNYTNFTKIFYNFKPSFFRQPAMKKFHSELKEYLTEIAWQELLTTVRRIKKQNIVNAKDHLENLEQRKEL